VSCAKTVNIKQYLNTKNFSSNLNKQHDSILIKYLTCRMKSCSNRVIELNLKILILAKFVAKNICFHVRIKKTDFDYLNKWMKII
jgi:hypothetical protein